MYIEPAAYDAILASIVNYPAYSAPWNTDRIFFVEDFESDIPSGTIHMGLCPLVAVRGGVSDDFTQVAGDLFEGTLEFEILVAVSRPLVYTRADWNVIQEFTGDIERAVDSIDAPGFKMKPQTSKGNPVSLKGMETRVLTLTIDASECRGVPVT